MVPIGIDQLLTQSVFTLKILPRNLNPEITRLTDLEKRKKSCYFPIFWQSRVQIYHQIR